MLRLLAILGILLCMLTLTMCKKSGATYEEKQAALKVAEDNAKKDPDVGPSIISMNEAHGKLVVVIKEGVHPMKQAHFIQYITQDWFNAFPEGKKPTKNDMIQLWLYENNTDKEEVGFEQLWIDEYGKQGMNYHHYKTQNVM